MVNDTVVLVSVPVVVEMVVLVSVLVVEDDTVVLERVELDTVVVVLETVVLEMVVVVADVSVVTDVSVVLVEVASAAAASSVAFASAAACAAAAASSASSASSAAFALAAACAATSAASRASQSSLPSLHKSSPHVTVQPFASVGTMVHRFIRPGFGHCGSAPQPAVVVVVAAGVVAAADVAAAVVGCSHGVGWQAGSPLSDMTHASHGPEHSTSAHVSCGCSVVVRTSQSSLPSLHKSSPHVTVQPFASVGTMVHRFIRPGFGHCGSAPQPAVVVVVAAGVVAAADVAAAVVGCSHGVGWQAGSPLSDMTHASHGPEHSTSAHVSVVGLVVVTLGSAHVSHMIGQWSRAKTPTSPVTAQCSRFTKEPHIVFSGFPWHALLAYVVVDVVVVVAVVLVLVVVVTVVVDVQVPHMTGQFSLVKIPTSPDAKQCSILTIGPHMVFSRSPWHSLRKYVVVVVVVVDVVRVTVLVMVVDVGVADVVVVVVLAVQVMRRSV